MLLGDPDAGVADPELDDLIGARLDPYRGNHIRTKSTAPFQRLARHQRSIAGLRRAVPDADL